MNQKELNLRPAFPAIPQDVYQALMGAAQSVREEQAPRHRPLRLALAAALVLVILMAAAYAAFPDQVARFFGRHYGADTQEWLKQGQAACPTDSLVFSGQTFTLEEVVYRNQGLYGLVRVRGDQAQAAEIYLNQVGVDGGPLMAPGVVGLDQEVQEDGSVLHSFEVADGMVIGQGRVFQLVFEARVQGETREWLVAVEPLPQAEPADAPGFPDSQAPGQREGSYDIILPEAYKLTGSLPVYRARLKDLGEGIQPALFNQSGIAEQRENRVVFQDGAVLDWSPEALFYKEYQGSYEAPYQAEGKDLTHQLPRPTLAQAAAELAGMVQGSWPDASHWQGEALAQTALSQISLKEAQSILENRLDALDVQGYRLAYALDMDRARIARLGATYQQLQAKNPLWNKPEMDYNAAGPAEEGYYLYYWNGVTTDEQAFGVHAYVTSRGIVHLVVRDLMTRGEVQNTPEQLLSAADIIARLPGEIARSRFSEMQLKQVLRAKLTYAIRRMQDGSLVMTPAWHISYLNTQDSSTTDYAIFDAVDGQLLNARFL
ncbi:MAG: hypothetical protein GX611_01630 [Clostridiales bacterium]|nr:hypothetical protein [Clostridiales bacterium]